MAVKPLTEPLHPKWRIKLSQVAWLELLTVFVIFLVALFLRVYRLQEFPPGLHTDEAANGLDAMTILNGQHPIFFPNNSGREPLFLYLQAGMMALLGPTPFALRLTAAIVGSLSVPAAYWMVREAFWGNSIGAKRLATWSALFMAVGYWHVSLNRLGFRANLLPLVAAITFALFWRAWRKLLANEKFPWLLLTLTGIALGLALYTYTASRFLPIIVVILALATLFQPGLTKEQKVRVVSATAVIALASAIVFAPLGWYFLQNPDLFTGRAASVSVFSEQYAEGNPWWVLTKSIGKTILMFLVLGDPNLRHNPAERPVFDILLGLWFYAGVVISLWRRRQLPYLFLLTWAVLMALPAALTAESMPHSLRAGGMIPIVYVFPVVALLGSGDWLAARTASWSKWLPLPFLLFSAITSVYTYFAAWDNISRFSSAFMTNYVQLAEKLAQHNIDGGTWLLTLSPGYFVTDTTFYTIDFLTQNKVSYTNILVDPETAPIRMAEALNSQKYAYLLSAQNTASFPEASYILGDPKHLVQFLLDKYGMRIAEHDDTQVGLPYLVYQLPQQADYAVFGAKETAAVEFDGRLALTALSYGRTAQGQNPINVNQHQTPSGEPLWVALQWQASVPIDIDLKTSLLLRDAAGNVAGQVDDLLVGDRYPVERVWEAGEDTASYHILPVLPGVAPGRYEIVLRVYEDQTLRPYPAVDSQGNLLGSDTVIGSVEITPAQAAQAVAPEQLLPAAPQLAPNLSLLGYDLPTASVAPGDRLPLTLYWQASDTPDADYSVNLQLRAVDTGGEDAVAAEMTAPLTGSDSYPPTAWTAGTTLRDWQTLAIAPDTSNGGYELWVALIEGEQRLGELKLSEITVEGRLHTFSLPPITTPISATFGQYLQLFGLENAPPSTVRAGETLQLPLVWQVIQPSTRPLVRFVHLLGADGRPLAQQDGAPCSGECPANRWIQGEVLQDEVTLNLPTDLAAGEYTVATGWYDAETLQRLDAGVAGEGTQADQLVRLIKVQVVAP